MADMIENSDQGITRPERLSALREMFTEARDQTAEARGQSEIDLDYYNEHQWNKAEKEAFKKRKQPIVTFNAIKSKIESICGVEEQAETAPKAWPRTPADEGAAQVVTDTLRFVCDTNRFDKARIDILRDTLICGTGGIMVEVEQAGERLDIKLRRLRWETIFYDPYSRETDFSDARYLGCAAWMNATDVLAMYGEAANDAVQGALTDNSLAEGSFEDRPNSTKGWADRKNRRILVVEAYNRIAGVWHRSVFTGYGVILDGESPYQDADGKPTCPIELVSTYVDRENNRYGEVRGMRSAQDEINHRRSKLLHLLNTKQTFRREGTIATNDPQGLRRELNKPDGDIVIAKTAVWGQDIGIIEHSADIAGQAEMLNDAWRFIDKSGANNAMMGRGTESQSGRAILAQQQAGLQSLATVYANYGDWILRVYRQVWGRARQFWTAPMFIRVTDDLDAPKFIQVNEPIIDQFGMPVIDPMTGQPKSNNRIAEMDVDLIIDRTPASANIQQEEFATLLDLAQKTGIADNPEVKIALIAASSLRPKAKKAIIEALQKTVQQPDPQQIQMMVRQAMAEIAKTETQAAKNAADAQKTQAEMQLMGVQFAQQQAVLMPPSLPQEAAPPQLVPPDQGAPTPEQPQPPQPGGFFNEEDQG